MRRNVLVFALVALAGVLVLPGPAQSQEDTIQVIVTNFPDSQKVSGSVSVDGPVRHGTLLRVREALVPPVDPKETTRLVDGGSLSTDGFTGVALSLNGQARGTIVKGGAVGAILIPEEESVTRAFEEEAQPQFQLEVSANITAGSSRSFASSPARVGLAFPRYRVHFYNTSDKTVTVNLFAYLTN